MLDSLKTSPILICFKVFENQSAKLKLYKQILRSRSRSRRLQHQEINKLFIESFHEWLSQTVWSGKNVDDEVNWLSQGPNRMVKRYSAFVINGFRFHTQYCERLRRTQNCGIVVNSSITSYASARDNNLVKGNVEYFGLLMDIIELDYYGKWKVVLFREDWADVNTAHPIDEGWYVVLRNIPRDLFDIGNGSRDNIDDISETLPFLKQNLNENIPSTNKMPRRKLRYLSIVQNTPNSEETNSEQQTAIGSLNVPITPDDPTEIQSNFTFNLHAGRGRTLRKYLYELDLVEHVKVCRNYFGQPVGSEARLLAGYLGILA
ncbi:hypothetical protein Gotur_029170 [Gossypium turneri]